MGKRKVAKTEPGSEFRLERLANHILRRERRRKGAQPRCIDSIIAALRDTHWYLSILPSDIVASHPELDDVTAVNSGVPGTAAGIAGGPPVAVPARDHAGIAGGQPVGVPASSPPAIASSCMERAAVPARDHAGIVGGQPVGVSASSSSSIASSCMELHPELPMDQISELVLVMRRIEEVRGVSATPRIWETHIEGFGYKTFLRIEFDDWRAQCAKLSDEWETSWHGALTPFILNIVLQNGIYPTEHVGAGGKSGLFHSNNKGLHYPFKYAYPSPISGIPIDAAYAISGVEGPLYHSLIEIRVNPMKRCKRGSQTLPWHVTLNKSIPNEIRLSAALFCIYSGPRTERHMRSSGHILMLHGVPFDSGNL